MSVSQDAMPAVAPHAPLSRLVENVPWRALGLALAGVIVVLVCVSLHETLQALRWADVEAALAAVPLGQVALAFAATAVSYLALVGYELIAVRHVGASQIKAPYAAVTAFIAYSFTFVLGFGVLTGGAVRLRRYQRIGVETSQILAITLLGAVSFWAGLAATAGLCLVLEPGVIAPVVSLPEGVDRAIGIAVLAGLGGWLVACAVRSPAIAVSGWTVRLPGPGRSLAIMGLGLADTAFAALALWLILHASTDVGFIPFLIVFALATVAGVISHAPGGVGAFEAVILLGMPGAEHAQTVAALIVFRMVYYAVPFALGLIVFGLDEARSATGRVAKARDDAGRTLRPLLPAIAAVSVFAGGSVLLLSGTLPAEGTRLDLLTDLVPLPFVEASHFVASVAGGISLIVGYGLLRRLRSSWTLAMLLLAAGAAFSILKGFDYEEALVCIAVMGLLGLSRGEFYRRGGLGAQVPSARWLFAVAVVIGLCIWVGLAVYSDVDYSNALWWQFDTPGDASRFLRASLGASVAVILVLVYRLLHAPAGLPDSAVAPDTDRVRTAVGRARRSVANLALLGDKSFLFSELGEGFLMYGVSGSTWLAMSDPVAEDEKVTVDLIWRFKELADRNGGQAAFYEVSAGTLPYYIDAGFSFAKLGEEAIVDLQAFTMDGPAGSKFRQIKSRAERQGLAFAVVPAAEVPAILPDLEAISDEWLAAQKGREKGFSLGFWSPAYVTRFDCAVVTLHGRPIAFANLWNSAGGEEQSIDLMRHLSDMPNGTMDYLFVLLFAAAKATGVRAFNLGMAPLAGMHEHRLAPAWTRLGSLIYRHGSQFYNFAGLREFKNKFRPTWSPRYLAHAGGLSVARTLVDAALIISKGPALSRQRPPHAH